jgi:hypothetical protein
MAQSGLSKTNLNRLWRRAVLASYHNMCPCCGNTFIDEIECHHIVKRRNALLKYDYRNGIPGCKAKCHDFYHTLKGEKFIMGYHRFYDYICDLQQLTLKEYLFRNRMTKKQFLLMKKKQLEGIIKNGVT